MIFSAILPRLQTYIESDFNVSDDARSESNVSEAAFKSSEEQFQPKVHMGFAAVKNGDFVELSHVDENHTVHIRSVTHDKQYAHLLQQINKTKTSHVYTLFRLNIGDTVLGKLCGDYSRASVTNEHPLRVQFIDIGLEKDMLVTDLRYIRPEEFKVNRMVTPVRLNLPHNMTKEEKSAVLKVLKKWEHTRFKIESFEEIAPDATVNLLSIRNGESLTNQCKNVIDKRWTVDDIGYKQIVPRENVDLHIVDNQHLSTGFICCVLADDMISFSERCTKVADFGSTQIAHVPYEPDKLEMCIVMSPDEDGTEFWYRAQFHQILTNERAQVGLIDFGCSAVVSMQNIRKFNESLLHERVSFIGKIRRENTSLELLNRGLFQNFFQVTATRLQPVNDKFEFHFDEHYFFEDDDFI